MILHPDFNENLINSIGVWKDNNEVVGLAVYDMYFGEAFCGTLPEYKELFPADLTVEYLNNRDNQIEIWKRLCVYSVDLKSNWSIQYMEDDLIGDMREVYKWLCKESDKIVTKEDSIKSYKKFAKNISDTFKTCAKKLKEEEEFKEV